ncbi:MAG: hypothetical protein KGL40_03970 [Rhodocyclaceae bacterium]|nr:hypothetical protein [Rhodocyclaceae bacterium]
MSVEELKQDGVSQASKVLSFSEGAARRAAHELLALLQVYDRLIALLRETDNDGLDMLTDGLVLSAVRCRAVLAQGGNDAGMQQMTSELRAGLREMPGTLRALLPGLGPRLVESLQHKLGIQFLAY